MDQTARPAQRRPAPIRNDQGWVIAAALLIVAATFCAFAGALKAPFLFDDHSGIINNPTIRRVWPLQEVLFPPPSATGAAGRPLVNVSLAINYAFGGLDPWGYHAVNTVLHALAALLLFGMLHRIASRASWLGRLGARPTPIAAGIAILWAVHPLQTESVGCVIQRSEILGALFVLLGWYCFVRSIDSTRRGCWQVGFVAATWLGVLSKEFAALTPILVIIHDRTLKGTFREAWHRHRGMYAGAAASWLLLAVLIASNEGRGGSVGFNLGISPWEYLLTQCRAIGIYLQLSIWPDPLIFDYGAPVVTSLTRVWPLALLLLVLALATGLAIARRSLWALPGCAFFALLAPSSSFVPLTTQTIAEHRMYLPLAAVLVVFVAGAIALTRRPPLVAVTILLVAAGFGVITHHRLRLYESPLALWTETAAQAPENPRAHVNLGNALAAAGRHPAAVASFRKALSLDPTHSQAHFNLGNALARIGEHESAIGHYNESLRIEPRQPSAHNNLGLTLAELGRVPEGIAEFRAAIELDPQHAGARFNLAQNLVAVGRVIEAEPEYRAAITLNPDSAKYRLHLAAALLALNRNAEAIPLLQEILRTEPDHAGAQGLLASASAPSPGHAPR